MRENIWNPWKMTTVGLVLVGATALVTTLVVGYRGDQAGSRPARSVTYSGATQGQKVSMPRQIDVDSCNADADQRASGRGMEVVKDVAVGGLMGAGVGAAGGAIADGGKGAGKGAAIGGLVGATAGTLYGLNDDKKHDAEYQAAYRSCMRQRGYAMDR